MRYYVYILTNKRYGTLYTGFTNDLARRITEHREGEIPGFTKKHNLKILVYHEIHEDVAQAQKRERNIKAWKRQWKIDMIEEGNPNWYDLFPDFLKKTELIRKYAWIPACAGKAPLCWLISAKQNALKGSSRTSVLS